MKSKKENSKFQKILEKYNYSLPPELIAQEPASPRDTARLLICTKICTKKDVNKKSKVKERWEVQFDTFLNLTKYLPSKSILVFNDTKVLPARLTLIKPTSGKVNVLYTEKDKNLIKVMADRKLEVGWKLTLNSKIHFLVCKQSEKYYYLKPSFSINRLFEVLEKYGKTPIPPYIKKTSLLESELKKEYQTIFAKQKGSVAAPTASLHFTKRLFAKLKSAKIATEFITLHVGLGTFAPLSEENFRTNKLHEEFYSISPKTAKKLNQYKKEGRLIIAVGTTTVRALESAASKNGKIKSQKSKTGLFIKEGYKFKFVDGIITNFHVPKSSLMMLVSAFVGRKKLMKLYQLAIEKKFRFFSFGDGMLIIKHCSK